MSTKNTTPESINQIDEVYFAVIMHVDGENVTRSSITNLAVTVSSYRLRSGALVQVKDAIRRDSFQRYLIPNNLFIYNAALMATSEWTHADLCKHGEKPEDVAQELRQFINHKLDSLSPTSSKRPKAVMIGYGIEEEAAFLANLFAHANISKPFAKVLDLRTVHAAKMNISLRAAKRKNLPNKVTSTSVVKANATSSLIDDSNELAILGYNLLDWTPDPF